MTHCTCGSARPERKCCGPILAGKKLAETPEALVRARFTAFARGDLEFLVASCHPKTVCRFDPEVNRSWAEQSEFHGLEIVACRPGAAADSAIVEFRAAFTSDGMRRQHHEISEFRRVDGRWTFYDGKRPGD
ncbi:MAG: hypothetical protein KDB80_03950 [Planctomycetes bacterium]|nr:hypothetical protein [Planctomycetota bacterium]